MAEIKPAEISAILRKQVEGFESGATLEEVGTVLQVGDGIARIGLSNVQYGELVEFDNGLEAIVFLEEEMLVWYFWDHLQESKKVQLQKEHNVLLLLKWENKW
jgi:F0F1-type ATP synthase alpha subunit